MFDKSVQIWNGLAEQCDSASLENIMFVNNIPTELALIKNGWFDSILDFGCGLGRNAKYLRTMTNKLDGYDVPSVIDKTPPFAYDRLYSDIDLLSGNKYELIVVYFTFQFFHSADYCNYIVDKLSSISNYIYVISRCYMEDSERANLFNIMFLNNNIKLLGSTTTFDTLVKVRYPDHTHFEALYQCVHKGEELVIDCDKSGFGDIMTLSWILEGAKNTDTKIVPYATNEKKKLFTLLGQNVTDNNKFSLSLAGTFANDQREIYNNKIGRLESWLQYIEKFNIVPMRPRLLLTQRDFDVINGLCGDNTIVLCPESIRPHRTWPMCYWQQLIVMLKKHKNIDIIAIGKTSTALNKYCKYVDYLDWRKIAAMFKMSKMVVGNDSAPINMAGITNTKAIALLGPTTKEVFKHLNNVQCISSNISCAGCWFSNDYKHDPCECGCVALSNITPLQVYKEILKTL